MDKENMTILGCFGVIALLVIIIPGSILMHGWVLSILWGWFVVPLFHLPVLSIPYAIGLASVVSMFKGSTIIKEDKDKSFTEKIFVAIAHAFVAPLFMLFFGWIITLFL